MSRERTDKQETTERGKMDALLLDAEERIPTAKNYVPTVFSLHLVSMARNTFSGTVNENGLMCCVKTSENSRGKLDTEAKRQPP